MLSRDVTSRTYSFYYPRTRPEGRPRGLIVSSTNANYDDWASLNTQFHLTIGALPGLALLREMTERVLARWGRVRRFYFRGVLVRRAEQAQQEHRAILKAMRSRDLAALEALVRQHNRRALDAYMTYLDGDTDRRPARVIGARRGAPRRAQARRAP